MDIPPDSAVPDDSAIPPLPPTPQQQARAAFDGGVYPVLLAKCIRCHTTVGEAKGPPFLSPDVTNAYDTIVGRPTVVGNFSDTGAKLYTFVQGGHFGPYLPQDQGKMLTWLGLELQARAPATPATP